MSIDYNTKRKRRYKNTLISALIAIVIHIARRVGIFPGIARNSGVHSYRSYSVVWFWVFAASFQYKEEMICLSSLRSISTHLTPKRIIR